MGDLNLVSADVGKESVEGHFYRTNAASSVIRTAGYWGTQQSEIQLGSRPPTFPLRPGRDRRAFRRPAGTHGRGGGRFPLCHCPAVARVGRERETCEEVPIEVVDLGVRGVGFKIRTLVMVGGSLTIGLRVPGLVRQTWHCRIVSIYAFDGTHYHVGAAFEAIGDR